MLHPFDFFLPLTYQAWIVVVTAYMLGSIPWGLLLTRWSGRGDIRRTGSGNIGATNVLRTGSKPLAFLTLLLDILKGYVAVKVGAHWHIEYTAALMVMIGHIFPVWLMFKGGKGVATYGGVLFALSLPLGSQALLSWVSFAFLFRYSSLASLITCLIVPFTIWLWNYGNGLLITSSILSLLVIFKHSPNIGRLIKGKEPKIGKN